MDNSHFNIGIPQNELAIFHIDDNANNVHGFPEQTGWPANENYYNVTIETIIQKLFLMKHISLEAC